MTKKQFIRSVAFFMVVAIMVFSLCDLFELENTSNFSKRYALYRNFPEDTVDAIILGTSGIDRYWIPSQAYEDYGMTVYPLSIDAFPAWLYVYAIDEALRYQDPELIIIDTRAFCQDNIDIDKMDVSARRFLDVLPALSPNKIKSAFTTMEVRDNVNSSASRFDLSYLFSIIKFHTKWEEDNYSIAKNWGEVEHKYLGFHIIEKNATVYSKKIVPTEPFVAQYYEDLDPYSAQALHNLINYIKENQLNVLFLETPRLRDLQEMGRANTIYSILKEEGLPVVHYYSEDSKSTFSIDSLDLEKDFYNAAHVNFYGAEKFTDIFSLYLRENYKLPDRRNDEKVKENWDGVHKMLLEKIKDLEVKQAASDKKS